MSSLLESIMGQLGGDAMKQISGKLGTDESSAGNATSAAVTALLGALSKNAQQPGGAEALASALQRDHDGSMLENLGSLLGGGGAPQSKASDGAGILRHVLGGRQQAVERGIGGATGIDSGKIGGLLASLAPVVMGALGKQQRQQGLDAGSLAGMLGQERQTLENAQPKAMGALSSLLDQDGDGDVDLGDLVKGSGMLGKLFGR